MKKRFGFKTRLVIMYTFFTVLLTIILSTVFYLYSLNNYSKNLEDNLRQITQKTQQQLDASIYEMDGISREIYSNWDDVKKPLSDLYSEKISDLQLRNMYLSLDNTISSLKFSYGKITRISVFSTSGHFATSGSYKYLSENDYNNILSPDLIKRITLKDNAFLLVPPEKDHWANDNNESILSFWRAIKTSAGIIGYIEIQKSSNEIKEICNLGENSKVKVLVTDSLNNAIYPVAQNKNEAQSAYIENTKNKNGIVFINNPETKKKEIVSYSCSDYTGWTVFIIQDYRDYMTPMLNVVKVFILITLGIIVLTVLVFYLLSNYMTKPLKLLKTKMEAVTMETLPNPVFTVHENDEIQALNLSFVKMKNRLDTALKQEMQSHSLQLQAHFNALQAQINPHFLHNMLGIISSIGDDAELIEISEICSNMSKMLRYSTSTKQNKATIIEEIGHTTTYLYLMKKRYHERLEYSIDIDEAIMEIEIPRLIIQPIVENSIYHGYKKSSETMKISITGRLIESGWYIEICDNGSGFEQNALEQLMESMEQYSKDLLHNNTNLEMSIGGMGLLNTYTRLKLFYDKELRFELRNNETSGACITIGVIVTLPLL